MNTEILVIQVEDQKKKKGKLEIVLICIIHVGIADYIFLAGHSQLCKCESHIQEQGIGNKIKII